MRIVDKAKQADLVVCLGDISFFENGLPLILRDLDLIGKKVLMLPGNHEDEDTLKKLCKKTKFIHYFHKDIIEIEGITFFSYGGGGFLIEDPRFDETVNKFQTKLVEAKKIVLLTHQPPFNTVLDVVQKKNVGNLNIKDFIRDYNPIIAVSGHIHDNFYKEEKFRETLIFNPGPKGKIIDI